MESIKHDLLCYVCYEKEISQKEFCENICDCKGYNLHKICFQKLYNKEECSICKSSYKNIKDLLPKKDGMVIIIEIDKYDIKHEYTKDIEGLKHGTHKIFYPNGKLWEENYYTHGIKEGIQKLYDLSLIHI
jgi:hypothetical protein